MKLTQELSPEMFILYYAFMFTQLIIFKLRIILQNAHSDSFKFEAGFRLYFYFLDHLFFKYHYYKIDVWPTYRQTYFKTIFCLVDLDLHRNFSFGSQYPKSSIKLGVQAF